MHHEDPAYVKFAALSLFGLLILISFLTSALSNWSTFETNLVNPEVMRELSGAAVSLSANSINFSNKTLDTNSAAQPIPITYTADGGVVVTTPTNTPSEPYVPPTSSGGGGGGGGGGVVGNTYTFPDTSTSGGGSSSSGGASGGGVVYPTGTSGGSTVSPSVSISLNYTRPLSLGSVGNDVRAIQQLLALDTTIYPDGTASGYYGPLTQAAVQRFQTKYGIVSSGSAATTGYGAVGPRTVQKIIEVFGGKTTASSLPTTSSTPASTSASPAWGGSFTRNLYRGLTGSDVYYLQKILNRTAATRVAPSGTGSPGNESTYYGALTELAVKKLQVQYGIVSSGNPNTTGYGAIGPRTRAILNSLNSNQ